MAMLSIFVSVTISTLKDNFLFYRLVCMAGKFSVLNELRKIFHRFHPTLFSNLDKTKAFRKNQLSSYKTLKKAGSHTRRSIAALCIQTILLDDNARPQRVRLIQRYLEKIKLCMHTNATQP